MLGVVAGRGAPVVRDDLTAAELGRKRLETGRSRGSCRRRASRVGTDGGVGAAGAGANAIYRPQEQLVSD